MNDAATNEKLARLADWLSGQIQKWRLPPRIDTDEVVFESVERLWMKGAEDFGTVANARNWLRRTAKNIVREHIRKAKRFRVAESFEQAFPEHCESDLAAAVDSAKQSSVAWASLSPPQKRVIEQCVMLDRPYAEVARELKMKRQTVAGWAKRIPPRLATEPAFQSLNAPTEVTGG